MRNWNSPLGIATLILGLLLSASASAAPITWGTPQDVMDVTDVSTSQTLVEAVNLTPDDLVPGETTVNGVTFTHDSSLMGLLGGTGLMPNDTGDSEYNALLNSVDHGDSLVANPWVLQLGGGNLVAGSQYELQLFYSDNRGFAASNWGQNYGDGEGNSVTLNANGGNLMGQHVTGTFTAGGTTQALSITGGGPPGEPHLSAYQLRFVGGTPLVPGDIDENGVVNELDLEILLANFFITDPKPQRNQGNLNSDATVDASDFLIWRTEFLNAGGTLEGLDLSSFKIPEPSSAVLLGIGLMAFARHRRRSCVCAVTAL